LTEKAEDVFVLPDEFLVVFPADLFFELCEAVFPEEVFSPEDASVFTFELLPPLDFSLPHDTSVSEKASITAVMTDTAL
jgi:hypothetical protein